MSFSKFIFIFSFGCTCLLSACVNDMEKIKQVTFDANDPDEKTRNLKMVYSDSGMAKLKLYAPIAETFTKKDGKVVQFNEGVLLEFYKSNGRLGSSLTAQYGEINETTGKMMVRDSVRMFNTDKKQTMETEVLYWNKKDSTIFTDQLVTIKTPKMLIFGKGLKTKQDFSSYEFLEPQGRIKIDK